MNKLKLTNEDIKKELNKWNENKSINPFTQRKIKINGPTYKKLEKKYIDMFDGNFYKNKENTKIDSIIYNIFLDKYFNKSYDMELKNYLRIFVYLEFRSRELYIQYINIPDDFKYKTEIGQPFKNTRLIFYELLRLNKIPVYSKIIINDYEYKYKEDNSNKIEELKNLYKSYYELLEEHIFEDKYITSQKDITFEKNYIKEELKDTNEYFYNTLDKSFKKNPKYNNIKIIHKNLKINFDLLLCDNCGKKGVKLICCCGINVYCNEY